MEIDCNEMLRREGTEYIGTYSLERWCDVLDRGDLEGVALNHVIEQSLAADPVVLLFDAGRASYKVQVVQFRKVWWAKVLQG